MPLLTSCSTCNEVVKTVEVKIPIPINCPEPPIFETINDPVLKFTTQMSIEDKIKDLRASRVLWRDRAKQQEIILNSYRLSNSKLYFNNYSGLK